MAFTKSDLNKYTSGSPLSLDLYGGAADCDRSKGTIVGSVEIYFVKVSNNEYNAEVTYFMNSGFTLNQVHIYAGSTIVPKVGKTYTVSPGQYTYNSPILDDVSSWGPVTLSVPAKTDFYMIAHAVVCGVPELWIPEGPDALESMSALEPVSRIASDSYNLVVYPNPFSTSTNFEISMNTDSWVRIEIFSNSGTPVQVILDEDLKQGDSRSISFDGTRYPNTLFIYRITTKDRTQSGMIMRSR